MNKNLSALKYIFRETILYISISTEFDYIFSICMNKNLSALKYIICTYLTLSTKLFYNITLV